MAVIDYYTILYVIKLKTIGQFSYIVHAMNLVKGHSWARSFVVS